MIWHGENDWQLARPFHLNGITVPKGFRYDGASIPRPLWWWNVPSGIAFPAATVHDWLYRTRAFTRPECDRVFYANLIFTGVRPSAAWLMYLAVRLFGGKAWRENRRRNTGADSRGVK